MGRLAPSHPISLHAPYNFRDHVDVLGTHLIWTGAMAGQRVRHSGSRAGRRHAVYQFPDRKGYCAARLAWSYVNGVDLTDDEVLVHNDACSHDACIAPGCYTKMTKTECGHTTGSNSQRAVS
jgi:hypothetical protein